MKYSFEMKCSSGKGSILKGEIGRLEVIRLNFEVLFWFGGFFGEELRSVVRGFGRNGRGRLDLWGFEF